MMKDIRPALRDFLLGERFCATTGCRLLGDYERIEINGEPVLLTTGRKAMLGLPEDVDSVILLDGDQAFAHVPGDYDIFWGAYLGTPDEILVSGRLNDVKAKIEKTRTEARRRHGWIMDTYLLRRRS